MVVLFASGLLAIAAALLYCVWRARWGRPSQDLPAVLTFHKVTSFEFGGTWLTPAGFQRILDSLQSSGHRFISEDEFLSALAGRRAPSEKEILLTFDDGYEELMKTAVPALRERGIPALIFLVTAYAGRTNSWELPLPGRKSVHLGWDQVQELADDPLFDFGSHSRSHRDLTALPEQDVRAELELSREVIGHYTGREARTFSYPFGRVNDMVAGAARDAGYEAAFTLYPPGRAGIVDPMRLRREGVWIIDSPFSVRAKVSRGRTFWFEDIKGRAINGVAALTPLFKRRSPLDR